jgi:hypothetical protein
MKSFVKSLVKRMVRAAYKSELEEIEARLASIEMTVQSLVSAFLATHSPQNKLKN